MKGLAIGDGMKVYFGNYKNQDVHKHTIENEFIKLEILDIGARLHTCVIKKYNLDVVQGFETIEGLFTDEPYMGATVGRVANRIKEGTFELNGVHYQLALNNNGNTLHGGNEGYESKIFDVEVFNDKLVCHYTSPHLEEGFPGELKLTVIYRLLDDGFAFDVETISDQDTICSITNHAYFNLNGYDSETALDNYIHINAKKFSHVDKNGLTLEVSEDVQGTPFDFTSEVSIESQICKKNEQLENGQGFDHNYIILGEGLRSCATARGKDCFMSVSTTMPCMHFYTANFLNSKHGKNGVHLNRRSSFCFETQYYPSAITYDCAEKPILNKGELKKHTTMYRFK